MSMEAPGYEQLAAVLQAAYDQAAKGKGAERHADNKPFHEQPMQTGSDMLGTDAGLAFQVIKKVREGRTFAEFERFEREMLGAINYIAGMVIWRRRQLPQPVEAPMTFAERVNEIDAALQEHLMRRGKSALGQAVAAAQAEVIRRSLEADMLTATGAPCPECGYPINEAGTHYATCSRLTAPKEFVEQVEQTFDELEGSNRTTVVVEEPRMPEPLRTDFIDALGAMAAADASSTEDPFAGAPEWAKFKAQDANGEWWWYSHQPVAGDGQWQEGPQELVGDDEKSTFEFADRGPAPYSWRDTLIERTSGQDPRE